MPTYEYACTACGHRLEAVQKFSDEALTQCPECGGALRKVFGAIGIVLKGSGFYKTDSRVSAGRPASAAKESKESSGSESSGSESSGSESTSSDTKPDTATKSDNSKPSSNGDKAKTDSKPAAATVS